MLIGDGGRGPLEGRVVLVSGATGGLGSAVTLAAAAAGGEVVAAGRDPERLAALARAAGRRSGTPPWTVVADVCREEDMARMREESLARFGRIDALVVAHGIGRRPGGTRRLPEPFARLPLAEWRALVDTNLTGAFLAARAVLPAMKERGSGSIVFVGSARGGRRGQAFGAAYCASKFALRGLAESLAEEVARDGIRVTLLQPEAVRSPLIAATRLGAGPFGSMAPERFGELVVSLLALPEDLRLPEPLFMPFTRRSGRGGEPYRTGA